MIRKVRAGRISLVGMEWTWSKVFERFKKAIGDAELDGYYWTDRLTVHIP